MALRSNAPNSTAANPSAFEISDSYKQGLEAGILGAVTIAVWFFLVDFVSGRTLFYTPNVLGTAIFRGGAGLDRPEALAVSFEVVLVYTWVHGLVFCAVGGIAAKLLELAEQDVNVGFGIVLLFVIFEFGFVGAALVFAEPVLRALTWSSVLIGNLLAAAVMAGYFWRHHANLEISP